MNVASTFRYYIQTFLLIFLSFLSFQAFATNHIVRVNELMVGLNGDSRVQFVEIVAGDNGQKDWGPVFFPEVVGRAEIASFNAAGEQIGRFVVPSSPDNSFTSSRTVLFATQEFINVTGIIPDFIMPPILSPNAGKMCFRGNEHNPNRFHVNLCLSYGGAAFTGNTEGAGPAHPATVSILGSQSLTRVNSDIFGSFGIQINSDFALGPPTPASTQARNTLGLSNDLSLIDNLIAEVEMPLADSLVNQGRTIFHQETFGGNGRTCASCHVESDQFGLSPATIAALPPGNPLFISQSNINTIVVNAAGSILPGAIPSQSQPSDFFHGGVITGSLGGQAVVLSGSSTTYRIIGGDSLNITGNILTDSNGNTGTLQSFIPGNLDGPNPVNASSNGLENFGFLQGPRALVLENINGFAQLEFFRTAPSLLNIQHTAPFGLSGEFADLASFSAGAVAQHFPKSLDRIPGKDFREPSAGELNALTVFQESILSVQDGDFDETNNFDRFATTLSQKRGRELFFGEAKCSVCHSGPVLATSDGRFGTAAGVNETFNTGVSQQLINIADGLPTEQDIGQPPNSRAFSTPTLFGVKRTAPFFHDNSVATLLEAVQFYDSLAFRNSPAFVQVGPIDTVARPQDALDIQAFLESLVEVPADFSRDLDFGAVSIGGNAQLIAEITNTGNAAINTGSLTLLGPDAAEFSAFFETSGPIAPGQTRIVNVLLNPTSAGIKSASLEFNVDDGAELYAIGISLAGFAGDSPEISVAPLSIDFGDQDIAVGATAAQSVTITNASGASADLSLTSVALVNNAANHFQITADSGEAVLAPGASRTLQLAFDPSTVGASSAALQIDSNDVDQPLIQVALSGNGIPPQLSSLSVTPAATSVPLGVSVNYTATGTFTDGATEDVTSAVNWQSSNPALASINSNGVASTLAQGNVSISASSAGVSSNSANLTIVAPELVSIAIDPISASIPLGLSRQFTASGVMTDGSNQDLSGVIAWSIDNPAIASVNSGGLVQSLSQGSTLLRGEFSGISATASISVVAPELISFTISPGSASVALGATQAFTASGTFSDNSVADVTGLAVWNSSNTAVATVAANGVASTLAQGSSTISASVGGVLSSNTSVLTVTAPQLLEFSISPAVANLFPGASQQFTATGVFTNGTQDITATVDWISSATDIVSINAAGQATALVVGSAQVSASSGGLNSNNTAQVNVNAAELVSITLNPAGTISLPAGITRAFSAIGGFNDGNSADISGIVDWQSNDTTVATVDASGVVTGITAGSAQITASSSGIVSTATTVNVEAPVLVSFVIEPAAAQVEELATIAFNAVGQFSDGSSGPVTDPISWSSQNTLVATIDVATGVATGVSLGTANINASVGELEADSPASLEVVTRSPRVRINEVFAGLNADSDMQFLELAVVNDLDKQWGPQGGESVGRVMLRFYNTNGIASGRFVVPNNPALSAPLSGGGMGGGGGAGMGGGINPARTILFATQGLVSATGVEADFIIPKLVMPIAGKVCVEGNPDNPNAPELNVCVAYGGTRFSGDSGTVDGANGATLPIMNSLSLTRNVTTESNTYGSQNARSGDFVLGVPTPAGTQALENNPILDPSVVANIGGEVRLPGALSLVAQGELLFVKETFLGNGRTCASCHVPEDAFGLFPSRVSAFADNDPLFVNEFNVNTLVLEQASQPSDLLLGANFTTSDGDSIRVLAGTGNQYFIYGGLNLLPGTVVTDAAGNFATVQQVIEGDLNALENSSVLRGPRALIVENINGFSEPHFLRGSPTLLNIQHTAPYGLSGEFPTLQVFSAGAVQQHFPLSLNRVDGEDFRVPVAEELDAISAFQDSILSIADGDFDQANALDRFVTTDAQKRGRDLFFGEAKCSACHGGQVLASSDGRFGTTPGVNENFNTGVVNLPINIIDGLPTEQDLGQPPNSREFNTPGLFGIRDTAPFFHDNSVATLFEAIQFYDSPAFRNSPAFAQVGAIDVVAITQNARDIEAFLNALEDLPFGFTRSLDFGVVDVGAAAGVTNVILENTGNLALTITAIELVGGDSGEFVVDPAFPDNGPIAAGGSRTIGVDFLPNSGGAKVTTLEITVSDGNKEHVVGVALSGIGAAAQVSISPLAVDFGSQDITLGASAAQSVFISNAAAANKPVEIFSVIISGADAQAFAIVGDTAQAVLQPGESRIVDVVFDPQTVGAKFAVLMAETDDAANNPLQTDLNGTGIEPVLVSITLSPETVNVPLGVGSVFSVRGVFSNGDIADVTNFATWTVGDPNIATINDSGQMSSLAVGTTTARASVGAITTSNEAVITITDPIVRSFVISPGQASIALGESFQFSANALLTDGTSSDISNEVDWISSDPAVANISTAGLVSSLGAGNTTISASLQGLAAANAASLTVTDAELVSIEIEPANAGISIGETQQFVARGTFTDNSVQDVSAQVSWLSSASAVASIDANGFATALSIGQTLISASSGSVSSNNATLDVSAAVLVSFDIAPAADTISLGESRAFSAIGHFSDGTSQDITGQVQWQSANPAVAVISANGLATSVAPGTTIISATSSVGIAANNTATLTVAGQSALLPGIVPTDWLDTGASNALTEDDSLFSAVDLGNETVFGTFSTGTNIHSHFKGNTVQGFGGYQISGRVMIDTAAGGVGVTFFSQYPNADAYYRLRRYGSNAFHISPHGTSVSGSSDTGVVPKANTWYRYLIRVEDTGSQTEIRARVWQDGDSEPAEWQVQVVDAGSKRLTDGTVGVWSYREGGKFWADYVVSPLPTTVTIPVPDVVGLNQDQALSTLAASGLTVSKVTSVFDDNVAAGNVVSQVPLAGTAVPAGAAVELVVSQGPVEKVAVPDVAGVSQDEATNVLTGAGLKAGKIIRVSSDTVPAGFVISQSPLAGDLIPLGSAVDLTVSSGANLYFTDFENEIAGTEPGDWVATGSGNSLSVTSGLFSVMDLGANKVYGTNSTLTNIHSHFSGGTVEGNGGYEYTGRMMMTSASSGIGVTFFSQYPNANAYYRLRTYSSKSFHLAPHPHGVTVSGQTDTGVVPQTDTWYRFRIKVTDTGSQTEILARVWPDGDVEPTVWQIQAVDAGAERLTDGTVGVWSYNSGSKFWDDLEVK